MKYLILFAMIIMLTPTVAAECTSCPQVPGVPEITLPEIQKLVLDNGLEVWMVEQHESPVVSFNLIMNSGADHDPLDKPGLAALTMDMLDEGTSTRSSQGIAEELESIGASLVSYATTEYSSISMETKTRHMDAALDVFSDIVQNPAFSQEEFDRLKAQHLITLVQQKDQPATVANAAFGRMLFPDGHPYGSNPLGTESALMSISRDDVIAFHARDLKPNDAALIIVGDIIPETIVQKLESQFVSWKPALLAEPRVSIISPVEERRVFLIDRLGSVQSIIYIGSTSIARSDPDFFPVYMMNHILGGMFNSRLNTNLREEKGFTYGVGSGNTFMKKGGAFIAGGSFVSDKTSESVVEILHEIDRMKDAGVTLEELDSAKKGLIGNFVLNFETPRQISSELSHLYIHNLPMDYYQDQYLQGISSVGTDDVQQAAERYLDPSRMIIVIVGDLATIQPGIDALQLGEVTILDEASLF